MSLDFFSCDKGLEEVTQAEEPRAPESPHTVYRTPAILSPSGLWDLGSELLLSLWSDAVCTTPKQVSPKRCASQERLHKPISVELLTKSCVLTGFMPGFELLAAAK